MNQDPPPLPLLPPPSSGNDDGNWEFASGFVTTLLRAAAVIFLLFGIRDLGGIPWLSLAISVGKDEVYDGILVRSISAISVGLVMYVVGTVVVWKLAPKISSHVRWRRQTPGVGDSLSANETFLFLAGIFAVLWAVAQVIRVFCPPMTFGVQREDVLPQSVGTALLTPAIVFGVGLWLSLGSHRIHAWLGRRRIGRQ